MRPAPNAETAARAAALAAVLAVAGAGWFAGPLAGQDDLRDTVVLKSGKEVRGRVPAPFAAGELLLVQGGKRLRFARADVDSVQLLGERIREFLDRRQKLRGNARAQWILVEWAQAHGLVNLARLQATGIALDGDDAQAHTFLGHRQKGDKWLWELDGKWFTRDQLATVIVRSAIALPGERFRVRTDGDLRAGIDALLDLEQLGVWWMDTFGSDLGLEEVLQPVEVFVHRDATSFPKWGFRPIPFFVPDPHGDIGHTFHTGAVPGRPRQLFFVGSQGLLYRALIGSVLSRDARDRVCPWLEIGLPMLAEMSFAGDPGFARPGDPRHQDLQAVQALGREYQLSHLLHLPMYGGFYLMDDTPTAVNWSAAATFVQYLLRADNVPNTRNAFLAYIRAALGEHKGDSSTLFDATMGHRVEDFEAPYRRWLDKTAGN